MEEAALGHCPGKRIRIPWLGIIEFLTIDVITEELDYQTQHRREFSHTLKSRFLFLLDLKLVKLISAATSGHL